MADQKKVSILLVEDEENLHEALKLNLELEGYEISSAFDGSQALKIIQQEYFDLIILDVMLPEVDGFTVCRTLRAQGNNTPVLFLTARGDPADRVRGLGSFVELDRRVTRGEWSSKAAGPLPNVWRPRTGKM